MIRFWPAFGLILLAFPILEIWVAFAAADRFGFAACFLWWLASVVLAMVILRTQKLALKTQMLMLAAGQRNPLSAVLWMARRTLAAILLLIPGFLSDGLALLLLLPWPMPRSLLGSGPAAGTGGFSGAAPEWQHDRSRGTTGESIDGEFERVESDAPTLPRQER